MSATLSDERSAHLTIHYPQNKVLSDDELLELSSLNKPLRFERSAAGDLIVMAPTGVEGSNLDSEINMQLRQWAKKDGRGEVFSSAGGFRLPNSAVRAPDASWVLRSRIDALSAEEYKKFAPLCPDFVIELRSASDSLKDLQEKMLEYLENGAKLGWLIDPQEKKVHVYTAEGIKILDNPEKVSGEPLLKGFELDVLELW